MFFWNWNPKSLLKKTASQKNAWASSCTICIFISVYAQARYTLFCILLSVSYEVSVPILKYFSYISQRQNHICGQCHCLRYTAELLRKYWGWSHRLQRNFIFLFQLPPKTDKYIGFLHFPFTRHKKYQRRSRPLFRAVPLSSARTSGLICPVLYSTSH